MGRRKSVEFDPSTKAARIPPIPPPRPSKANGQGHGQMHGQGAIYNNQVNAANRQLYGTTGGQPQDILINRRTGRPLSILYKPAPAIITTEAEFV